MCIRDSSIAVQHNSHLLSVMCWNEIYVCCIDLSICNFFRPYHTLNQVASLTIYLQSVKWIYRFGTKSKFSYTVHMISQFFASVLFNRIRREEWKQVHTRNIFTNLLYNIHNFLQQLRCVNLNDVYHLVF